MNPTDKSGGLSLKLGHKFRNYRPHDTRPWRLPYMQSRYIDGRLYLATVVRTRSVPYENAHQSLTILPSPLWTRTPYRFQGTWASRPRMRFFCEVGGAPSSPWLKPGAPGAIFGVGTTPRACCPSGGRKGCHRLFAAAANGVFLRRTTPGRRTVQNCASVRLFPPNPRVNRPIYPNFGRPGASLDRASSPV